MKMISMTSITSTIGVTLMSETGEAFSAVSLVILHLQSGLGHRAWGPAATTYSFNST